VGQAVLFAVLAALLLLATRRWLGDRGAVEVAPPGPPLNARTSQYVGRVLTLETAIANGQGRARLDDGAWIVYGPDGLPAGSSVRVVGVDGTALRVEAA
jgi:membrane protein implicated in regulation of membrane protease activity